METLLYNQETLEACLRTKWLGRSLFYYDSIGSTNEQAHLLAAEGASALRQNSSQKVTGTGQENADNTMAARRNLHGAVIVADRQTAGKGRRGRVWESPAGTNIYFTLLLKPLFSPDKASMLTLLMAYAVKEAISVRLKKAWAEETGMPASKGRTGEKSDFCCGIKWPNDVIINGKKVCGILTELYLAGTAIDHIVIGVGINVGKQNFAPELVDKATSLEAECGQPISRSSLLGEILQKFETEYESFAVQTREQNLCFFKEKYNDCLVNKDREVCVLDPQGEYRGIARGINDTGELLVELADGSVKEVYAGEVSVRGIYGYT